MPPDLLDDGLVEVAGVAHEVLADLVCVHQSAEDVVDRRDLTTLPQLHALLLIGLVDVLDPALVVLGGLLGDMGLELDEVRVGDDLGVGG